MSEFLCFVLGGGELDFSLYSPLERRLLSVVAKLSQWESTWTGLGNEEEGAGTEEKEVSFAASSAFLFPLEIASYPV